MPVMKNTGVGVLALCLARNERCMMRRTWWWMLKTNLGQKDGSKSCRAPPICYCALAKGHSASRQKRQFEGANLKTVCDAVDSFTHFSAAQPENNMLAILKAWLR